jgi:DNA-3-methyladenine glycosylase II
LALRITEETLPEALEALGRLDADFAAAAVAHGPPPLRAREPGFAALLRIIVAQQVSLASASAIWGRLIEAAKPLTPDTFLGLDDAALGAVGFSRQKMRYGRALADDLRTGRIDIAGLEAMDDETAIDHLVQAKGIGRWSAEVYLLFAMGRPDVWPADDVGLMIGVERLKGLAARPDRARMVELAEAWRPWRSVAARMLWHVRGKVGLPDAPPIAAEQRDAV